MKPPQFCENGRLGFNCQPNAGQVDHHAHCHLLAPRDLAAELSAHDEAAHALLEADRALVRSIAVKLARLGASTEAGERLIVAVIEELQRLDLDGCYRVRLLPRMPEAPAPHLVTVGFYEGWVRLTRAGNTKLDGSSSIREETSIGLEAAGFTVRAVAGSSWDLDVETRT